MRRQLELFSATIAATTNTQRMTFEEFHAANPHVYRELVKLARWYHQRGRNRLSMRALFEILRLRFIETENDGRFHLNNNFASSYSRLVMSQEADLSGLFELREKELRVA